ncbi:hypothetical protein ACE1AT_16935 [Pelatocladus sp. BLCC-F211]|uniref:hypothetical protein n=1 Tax=Pelatocladus sp. BLCC-F211 TaxID=3342752 RepID=UPI0035B8F55E
MSLQCPVCGTPVNDLSSQDDCSECGFPLKTPDLDQFTAIKIKSFIKKIIEWGQKLYNNQYSQHNLASDIKEDLNSFADRYELPQEINSECVQLNMNVVQSQIELFTTTVILENRNFLQEIESNLFSQIDFDNLCECDQKRQILKKYFNKITLTHQNEFDNKLKELESILLKQLTINATSTSQEIALPETSLNQSQQQLQNINIEQILHTLLQVLPPEIKQTQIILPQPQAEPDPNPTQLQQSQELSYEHQENNVDVSNIAPVERDIPQLEQATKNYSSSEYIEPIKLLSIEDYAKETSISDFDSPNIPHLEEYNKDPESLEKYKPILLSITDETIHQCRLGITQPILLEKNRRGNYWIIPENEPAKIGKYLVPKANLKINEYSLETFKLLFEIDGENQNNSSKFKVIKPALLIYIEQDTWQLKEPGIIKLEVDSFI